ncbi:MAG TPA: hypothetical protein VGJ99_02880 [Actinomycetota bacterium]
MTIVIGIADTTARSFFHGAEALTIAPAGRRGEERRRLGVARVRSPRLIPMGH